MLAVLRFLFFNVALSTTDVGTDFFTFLELLVDNPYWACLTLTWTFMPFVVRLLFYLYNKLASLGATLVALHFTPVSHWLGRVSD